MKSYRTKDIVQFQPGAVLGLNDDQVKRRNHVLVDLGNSVYRNSAIVEFKKGEIIGLNEVAPFYVALLDEIKKKPKPEKEVE